MSTEKSVQEALRWIRTAEDDLQAAIILKGSRKYSHACFHAQQAGEKSVKSVWYFADEDPWGHSIKKLIEGLQEVDPALYNRLKDFTRSAMVLDRFYIPTRYPNGLPDMIPSEAYTDEDADQCIKSASGIIERVKNIIPDTKTRSDQID